MTATATTARSRFHRPALGPPAAASAALAALFTSVGTYLDSPLSRSGSGQWGWSTEHDPAETLVLLVFVGLGTATVFGVVVRRALRQPASATAGRAAVLAGIGVLSLLVFWTGLPALLAGGAFVLARAAAPATDSRWPAVATTLAVLTVLAAGWLAVTG